MKVVAAFTLGAVVVLASSPSDARARIRMSTPTKPPAASMQKPAENGPARSMKSNMSVGGSFVVMPVVRPFAAGRPASAQPATGGAPIPFGSLAEPSSPSKNEVGVAAKTADAKPAAKKKQTSLVALSMNPPVRATASSAPTPALWHHAAVTSAPRASVCFVQPNGACVAR